MTNQTPVEVLETYIDTWVRSEREHLSDFTKGMIYARLIMARAKAGEKGPVLRDEIDYKMVLMNGWNGDKHDDS